MSLDKSLRSHGALERHRNVLTRAERIETLKDEEKWEDDQSIFGLPKVPHRKVTTKRIKVETPGAEGEAALGEAVPGAEGEASADDETKADGGQ